MINCKNNRLKALLPAIVLAICAGLFHPVAAVDIYKWTDADGEIHFSNRPPPAKKRADMEIFTYTAPPAVETMQDDVQSTAQSRTDSKEKSIQPVPKANVIIYSAVWCGVCTKAKRYMKTRGIPYTEYDIDASASARAEFKRLGGKGVPLILAGNQRMHGFGPESLEAMLRKAAY
ncbi:MAG: glutaredoxin family protein [Gammaproteobacteria bacterium]|nr:glutaredoxin family protein [Gammaproteobacteria bacterium]